MTLQSAEQINAGITKRVWAVGILLNEAEIELSLVVSAALDQLRADRFVRRLQLRNDMHVELVPCDLFQLVVQTFKDWYFYLVNFYYYLAADEAFVEELDVEWIVHPSLNNHVAQGPVRSPAKNVVCRILNCDAQTHHTA